jgi:hypothetical protein
MLKYFDQDFFKFLLGFTAILAFSLIVILVAKNYQNSELETQTANVINSTIELE